MILITSGTYVDLEFKNELGKLPPSFLPLSNSRLYSYQIDLLKKNLPKQKIFLSLPSDFQLTYADKLNLKHQNITILRIKHNLSLNESIVSSLAQSKNKDKELYILHGDTLIKNINNQLDKIYLSNTKLEFSYEIEKSINYNNLAWCGFFSFSNKKKLTNCLKRQNSFENAVKNYDKINPLKKTYSKVWFDFGHINTYFQSKSNFLSKRYFNDLNITNNILTKSSKHKTKIKAEYEWFEKIPPDLKIYIPNLIRCSQTRQYQSYEMEYQPSLTLSEIFVYGDKTTLFWSQALEECNIFLKNAKKIKSKKQDSDYYINFIKNFSIRINEYKKMNSIDFNKKIIFNGKKLPSINNIIKKLSKKIILYKSSNTVIHGDFCLSNILFNSRNNSIKLIDPKGSDFKSKNTIYGDHYYDIAKLGHSIIGLYDHIIAGNYRYKMSENFDKIKIDFEVLYDYKISDTIKLFEKKFLNKHDKNKIVKIISILFLSMLPLHSDSKSKQLAFLFNFLRIYQEYKIK